ncbi:hypothetical protein JW964_07045 [candidate division KSB1 bacterium]|nr:hypothetical protein [candidate division KSB1 bacterium]
MKFKIFMQLSVFTIFILLTFISKFLFAIDSDFKFSQYHDYAAMTNCLRTLNKKFPQLTDLKSIGKTENGKEIWQLSIIGPSNIKGKPKSAICIIGNLEGNHLAGTEQILYTADFITQNYGKVDSITQMLNKHAFYLIPAVNIDAAQHFFQKPLFEIQTNFSPEDDDADGLFDEDGPEDLNGDGLITQMRLLDSEGEWHPDSSDARLLKKSNPLQGQKGIYRLELEGIDNDGDALLNEDPRGGTVLNMNFPYKYPRFKAHAGNYPLSTPETHALVDFILAHREIALIQIYGFDDNLLNPPSRPPKQLSEHKNEESTQRRERKLEELNIENQDLFFFQEISKTYKKMTQIKGNFPFQSTPGNLGQWLYFQVGIPAVTTRLWWPPQTDRLQNQILKGDSTRIDSTQKALEIKATKTSPTKSSPNEELLWLKWIDTNRQGQGFIPWQKFKHPTLGEVEIGGFQPFIKSNPPIELLAGFAQKHLQFSLYLANLIPEIKLSEIKYDKQKDSVYLLTAKITKTGFLPVKTVFAQEKQLGKPVVVRLNLNSGQLLSGTRQTKLKNLVLNGSAEKLEWLILGERGTKIILEVLSETAGQLQQEIILN